MGTPILTADRVLLQSTTIGAGTYQLGPALDGFFSLAAAGIPSGSRLGYTVVDSLDTPTQVEVCEGIYTAGSPSTLTRAAVRRSSSGNNAVSWGPGTRYVMITPHAGMLALLDTEGLLPASSIPLRVGIASSGYNGTANLATGDTAFFQQAVNLGTRVLDTSVVLRGETGSTTACTIQMTAHIRNAADTVTEATLDLGRAVVHANFNRYYAVPGLAAHVFAAPSTGQFIRFLARIDQNLTPVAVYEMRAVTRCHLGA